MMGNNTLWQDEDNDRTSWSRFLKKPFVQVVLIGLGTIICVGVLALAIIFGIEQHKQPDIENNAESLLSEHASSNDPEIDASATPITNSNISSETRASNTNHATEVTRHISPLSRKEISDELKEPRPRWTATPLPTATPPPTPTPNPTFVSHFSDPLILQPMSLSTGEKWIDVNLTSQTLVAYEGARPVFQSLVSSGTSNHPTVTGQFRIWLRFRAQDMDGYRLGFDYYLRNVPYVQYFYEDYALHGTFWHSNFGTPMSHGCVNLPTSSAGWLFEWADYGTLVNIHR